MTFLESLKAVKQGGSHTVDYQHLLKMLHDHLATIQSYTTMSAGGKVTVDFYYVALTDQGRRFVETVEEAIKDECTTL